MPFGCACRIAWQTLTNKSSRALAEQLFWCSRRPSQGFIGLLVRDQQGCQALAQDIVVATHRLKEGRSFSDWHLERERKQGGLALLGGLLRDWFIRLYMRRAGPYGEARGARMKTQLPAPSQPDGI